MQAIKRDKNGLKALGLSNKQVDAYKYISLTKSILVFYAED